MTETKPELVLEQWQYEWMDQQHPDWHAWLDAHYDVKVRQSPDLEEMIWRVNDNLRRAQLEAMNIHYANKIKLHYNVAQGHGKTWLGSQINEQYRVAEDRTVPKLRYRGERFHYVHFDEQGGTDTWRTEPTHWGSSEESAAVLLENWLQRRSVCFRASSCGLA